MRWGERLEFVAEAGPGDFIYVPPYVPHQEINASDEEPLSCVLVRSGQEPVVVNLDLPSVEPNPEIRAVGGRPASGPARMISDLSPSPRLRGEGRGEGQGDWPLSVPRPLILTFSPQAGRRNRRSAPQALPPQHRMRRPRLPAGAFEFGRQALLLRPADAEIGDEGPVARDVERLREPARIEDRHPADAEAVRAGARARPCAARRPRNSGAFRAWCARRGRGPARSRRRRRPPDAPAPREARELQRSVELRPLALVGGERLRGWPPRNSPGPPRGEPRRRPARTGSAGNCRPRAQARRVGKAHRASPRAPRRSESAARRAARR